jgi:ComF family protein
VPRVSFALCARCLARGEDPAACPRHRDRKVWPAWIYAETVAVLVHALKYEGRTDLAPGLALEMARVVPARPRLDLVVAMPLHPVRRRERGYNQAALLARALSDALGVPCIEDALVRVRATRAQARLDPAARRSNVAGAFAVRRRGLEGRNVLLVDDVITTGATFDACLGALSAAGAAPSGVALAWAQ